MLFAGARPVDTAATSARRSRPAAADDVRSGEVGRPDDRCDNEKKDQCVHEKRRNDPFPSLFLLER
jgi:hypothetical protein